MELLIYEPVYAMLDMNDLVKNYTYQVSNGQAGENVSLSRTNYEAMLKNLKHKNGFVMAVFEHTTMNSQFTEMKDLCHKLIDMIDRDLGSSDGK